MHVDPAITAAGLLVGFVVGMTGMGGGALMTPILVLLFHVNVPSAVASDLVTAVLMKPVGGAVHARRGTVNTELVRWLMLGSIPTAFFGVFVLRLLGGTKPSNDSLQVLLGAVLIVACASILARGVLQGGSRRRRGRLAACAAALGARPFSVNRPLTVAVGAVGGLVVGMTSVGSGSLIIVALMLAYPMMSAAQLVGTDLVQAIPLVASAALGHILFGDFHLGLTASLALGAVPGAYLGARLSSRAPDGLVRPLLVGVLLLSALKLLQVPTPALGVALAVLVAVGPPLWGVVDALGWPAEHFRRIGQSRRGWIAAQGVGALIPGLGSTAAIAYFTRARPRLASAAPADRAA